MSGSSLFSALLTSYTNKPKVGIWVDENGTAHEHCKVLIFIGKDYLGEFPIDGGEWPSLNYFRFGIAYFCGSCGEVWGRLVLVDSRGAHRPFSVVSVACERHYDQWEVAGSLLAGPLAGLLEELPPAALKREVMVHLKKEFR